MHDYDFNSLLLYSSCAVRLLYPWLIQFRLLPVMQGGCFGLHHHHPHDRSLASFSPSSYLLPLCVHLTNLPLISNSQTFPFLLSLQRVILNFQNWPTYSRFSFPLLPNLRGACSRPPSGQYYQPSASLTLATTRALGSPRYNRLTLSAPTCTDDPVTSPTDGVINIHLGGQTESPTIRPVLTSSSGPQRACMGVWVPGWRVKAIKSH